MINQEHYNSCVAKLNDMGKKVVDNYNFFVTGKVVRIVGFTVEARGFKAPIGAKCIIKNTFNKDIVAVVTGFNDGKLFLMTLESPLGIEYGCSITICGSEIKVPLGESLLGRVIDGNCAPLDNKPHINPTEHRSLHARQINPLSRRIIDTHLDVGVKAINGLLTVGEGQRIGLFAGSGVGKSVLLGMMAKHTSADVIVVALIGERGREVKEFIEHIIGNDMSKTVVVASPADYSPVLRYNGALVAMTIAEYFRDQGRKVLLLMDSLTRFAQARREIALSTGEPPATRGYPPSVFALLPQLVERAGNSSGAGSITGLFTVLAEGDDQQEPIVDASRAILDGHVVLSRNLADMGHYPAIDIESSVSRVMPSVVSKEHLKAAIAMKRQYSIHRENKDLINIGAYAPGNNKELDIAIKNISSINTFLKQDMDDKVTLEETKDRLLNLAKASQVATKSSDK